MIELTRVSNGTPLMVNPALVAAVFTSNDGDIIVRLDDGRGFRVVGSYTEVCARLGYETTAPAAVEEDDEVGELEGPAPRDVLRGEDA